MGSNATLLWEISLITAVVAGAVLGFVRAWWFALPGAVVPASMVVVSRVVSNDTLPGSEDLSWRIVLAVSAVEVAVLFFGFFAFGASLRVLVDFLRRRTPRTPSNLNGRSA